MRAGGSSYGKETAENTNRASSALMGEGTEPTNES